ncbi:MAG: hypothetical protein K6F99_04090 [Lachnospiraceae bacterium]|nr:hypothetical protein [Lachnospiraceae bacterium]
MATYNFEELKKKYEKFYKPIYSVKVGGNELFGGKLHYDLERISIDLTSDYKASIATICINGVYDSNKGEFNTPKIKKMILLGSDILVSLGYGVTIKEVFRGFISKVDFVYDLAFYEEPVVIITAMDIKGIMMANNSSKRLTASYYSDAVKEIFDQPVYSNLKNSGIVGSFDITNTPDKPQAQSGQPKDVRIEMVGESDYDFVVKVAKRFNYEFFSQGKYVYFRKAKSSSEMLMDISPNPYVYSYDVSYDISGLVGKVDVRGVDITKGKTITASAKNSNKLSSGNKAKALISKQTKVYVDAAVETKDDAQFLATSLLDDMAYRLGSLRLNMIGLPEALPGSFINFTQIGTGVSNKFYITDVNHSISKNGVYTVTLQGKSAGVI